MASARKTFLTILVFGLLVQPTSLFAQDTFGWHGYAIARGAAGAAGPFEVDDLSAQLHLGVDWTPNIFLGAHAHLLARTDDGDSEKGVAGFVDAYVEANAFTHAGRFRFRGGAFFLPTSFENVDSLWENPYAISSSALNTWFGEEFRPIGLDVTWTHHGAMLGGTIYRGNDTFGALPPVRGWQLHDRWTLLGQRVPVDDEYYTSVSAETDGRLGWSARTGWTGKHFAVQYTHIDNRSDGLEYGELFNWSTKFELVGFGYENGDWTVAAESGWGPTFFVVHDQRFTTDIRASYVLVSRLTPTGRASVRVDAWDSGAKCDESLTIAYIWTPPGSISVAAEVATTGDDTRGQLQLRYAFSRR